MTFSRDSVAKIEAGKKTATTRVSGRYRVGGIYTINPYPATKNSKARFDPAVGYLQITEKEKVILGDCCPLGTLQWLAKRSHREEGFTNSIGLHKRFIELRLEEAEVVYFYRFKYLGKTDPRKARGKEK